MTKQEAIAKAKEMIYGLTEHDWLDLTKDRMEQRLLGIIEFISFAYNPSAKEFEDLKAYMYERWDYWKKH